MVYSYSLIFSNHNSLICTFEVSFEDKYNIINVIYFIYIKNAMKIQETWNVNIFISFLIVLVGVCKL